MIVVKPKKSIPSLTETAIKSNRKGIDIVLTRGKYLILGNVEIKIAKNENMNILATIINLPPAGI